MKRLHSIRFAEVIALFISLTLISCSSMKKVTTSTLSVHDTLKVSIHDTLSQEHTVVNTVRIHDTLIKFGGEAVRQHITAAQLAPAKTAVGTRVPSTWEVSDGILHQVIVVDTDGSITVNSNVDSIQQIITNLVEINHTQADSITHLNRSTTAKTDVTAASFYSKVVKTRIPWYVYMIIALLVVGEVVIRMYKLSKPKI